MQTPDEGMDGIEAMLEERIAEKRRVMERWQKKKEQAAQREHTLRDEIGELELALKVLRRVVGKPSAEEAYSALDMMRFSTQTVAESCYEIIRDKGGRAKVTEIIDILIAAYKLKDDRRIAYGTAVKSMERDERFVKVGPGEYGLAETQEALEGDF